MPVIYPKHRPYPIRLAALALLVCVAWQAFVVYGSRGGNWTSLFCTGSNFPVPPPIQRGTFLFPNSSGYDGQFYRYIAHDPFFHRGFARYIDDPRYRYSKILIPLIAYAAGAGSDASIDWFYIAFVDLSLAMGVFFAAKILEWHNRPATLALFFLALPAALTSIDRMLVDGPLTAIFAALLYFTLTGNRLGILTCLVLAPLIRETGILFTAGWCLHASIERGWKMAALCGATALPFLGWTFYILGLTPPATAQQIIGRPIYGQLLRLLTIREIPNVSRVVAMGVQIADFISVAGLIACLALGAIWGLRAWRTAAGCIAVLFAGLGWCLGTSGHLTEAYGFGRPVGPLLLWISMEAIRRGTFITLAAPAAVTVGVLPTIAASGLRAAKLLLRF